MGLFDKVRSFLGGHGCSIELVTLMGEDDPSAVVYPFEDASRYTLSCELRVSSTRPVTVLQHAVKFVAIKKHADGRIQEEVLGKAVSDESTNKHFDWIQFPYDLEPGESKQDRFSIPPSRIDKALKALGCADARAAVEAVDVSFAVKVTIDVKGTPMDPELVVPLKAEYRRSTTRRFDISLKEAEVPMDRLKSVAVSLGFTARGGVNQIDVATSGGTTLIFSPDRDGNYGLTVQVPRSDADHYDAGFAAGKRDADRLLDALRAS
jgi:hypothetical protein